MSAPSRGVGLAVPAPTGTARPTPARSVPAHYHAEYAWLGGEAVTAGVAIAVGDDGRIASVTPGAAPAPGDLRLRGITLPGLANTHSHAFHRALRGRVQRGGGTFWTWREDMYALADRLDPDTYKALAVAVFAEMALAGVTCVGEFHYVHHASGGAAYAEPNAMGEALIEAAREAGVRITLLDTCYVAAGFTGEDLAPTQRRFSDGDAGRWTERVDALVGAMATAVAHASSHGRAPRGDARIGAAIHSVRAVPAAQLGTVTSWAQAHETPLHVHLSEQRAENAACRAAHGCTPTELLQAHGALGPRTCAVHATHLTAADVALLGATGTGVCLCPTTERDLADGVGPARRLAAAGAPLSVGSDQHAVIDLFEEARAIELDERLASTRRGHHRAAALLTAATQAGHRALGWEDAGVLAPGAPADLVTVGLDSVRLAGTTPATALEALVFAATAADVRDVVVGGRPIVRDGRHLLLEDVPGALGQAIGALWAS